MASDLKASGKAKAAAKKASAKNRANIAEDMTEDERKWLANRLLAQYAQDAASLADWVQKNEKAYLLSNCEPTRMARELPWPNAANVVVPMLASACNQVSSRAYSAHFEQGYPRRVSLFPVEPSDIEAAGRADRCLNWQLISDMPDYESEWDLAFNDWPIFGHVFKKVTWDHEEQRPQSVYVPATDVKIAAGVRRVTSQTRVSHIYEVENETYRAEEAAGFFLEDAEPVTTSEVSEEQKIPLKEAHERVSGQTGTDMFLGAEDVKPFKLIEVSFFGRIFPDQDNPGYYKAILDATSKKLLRLTSRRVTFEGKEHTIDEIVSVPFIPDPRSGYGRGFGQLLTPLNEMVNTLFNLFIDSGALSNMPVLKESRTASLELVNGVWKPGARIKTNDMSQIEAFKLTGLGPELPILVNFLMGFGREISSVSEEQTGGSPQGVRDPTVRGTFARLEQGLTQTTTIIRRSTRQQKVEVCHIIKLNQLFLPKKKQFRVLGETREAFDSSGRQDFGIKKDVVVAADPSFASPQMRRGEVLSLAETMLRFPIIAGDAKAGIPPNGPVLIEMLREVLRTFGRIDLMGYLPKPPDPQQPPEVENQRILEGAPVKAKKGEDHLGHVIEHLKGFEFAENDEQRNAFRAHVNEHLVLEKLEKQEQLAVMQQQQAAQGQGQSGPPQATDQGGPAESGGYANGAAGEDTGADGAGTGVTGEGAAPPL